MPKTRVKNKAKKENKMLLKFLKQTKEGKFAHVDKKNLKFSRLEETIDSISTLEDNYYYNLS